ncbi:MAG TPA: hypothetical protein VFD57_01590, partial [Clostridia bacterium]|nr:hypothetical protein [Clostridia bacterium]
NKDRIFPGQKLLIKVSPNSEVSVPHVKIDNTQDSPNLPERNGTFSNTISLDIQDADIRDVLSLISCHMEKQTLLLEEPVRVNFRIENAQPYKALELLLQSLGMDYIEDNNLIIVGKSEKLQKEFFNQMVLTRFNLQYISSQSMEPLIKQLSIPVQSITMDNNPKTIWIQATPLALSKIKELISILDKEENRDGSFQLASIGLNNLTTDKLGPVIEGLDMSAQVITIPGILSTLWLQGSQQDIDEGKILIASLDKVKLSSHEDTLFLFKLNNISPMDAAERLEMFGYEGVQTIEFHYSEFGQDLLVLCPMKMKTKVTTALEGLDLRGLGNNANTIMLPIDAATGPHSNEVLESRRTLLIKLIDGIDDNRDVIDVSNILWTESGEEYRVLLLKSIPEIIHKANEMIKLIDSPK